MTYHKTKCIFPDTPNCNINTLNPMRIIDQINMLYDIVISYHIFNARHFTIKKDATQKITALLQTKLFLQCMNTRIHV